jgi:hypothetical protein
MTIENTEECSASNNNQIVVDPNKFTKAYFRVLWRDTPIELKMDYVSSKNFDNDNFFKTFGIDAHKELGIDKINNKQEDIK